MAANIALNKATVCSGFVLPYRSAKAVNGDPTTPTSRWLCNKVPSWIGVDLGKVYGFNRWVVKHMPTAKWPSPGYCMSDFKLQGSNDITHDFPQKTWFDIDSVVGNAVSTTDRSITSVRSQFVRVYVTKGLNINKQFASLMELEVYQTPSSPYLSALVLSTGTLSPAFGGNVFAYTSSVPNNVSSITVTPVAVDPYATIKVNNVVVQSGSASGQIPLNVGSNTITVQVTGEDGSGPTTYTVTVTRAVPNPYLSNLELKDNSGTVVVLSPSPFASNTFSYTATVASSVASVTVTPTSQDGSASITVNGTIVASGTTSGAINLSTGTNTITTVGTSGGVSQTYTVTVTKAEPPKSSDLIGLALKDTSTGNAIAVTPPFDKGTLVGYTATVDFNVSNITITPTPEDSSATVKVTVNNTVIIGSPLTASLNLGDNTVDIQVTAVDNSSSKTYTVIVTRRHSTRLSNLVIVKVGIGVNPTWDYPFSSDRKDYTVRVVPNYAKVTPSLEDSTATFIMKVNGTVTPITSNVVVPSTVTVGVASASGVPSTIYTVTLTH